MDATTVNLILAVTTIVLVLVTAYYAWQTQRMVKEMQSGRELTFMPMLTCELISDAINGVTETLTLNIANIGNAPAIGVSVKIDAPDAANRHWLLQETAERPLARYMGNLGLSTNGTPYHMDIQMVANVNCPGMDTLVAATLRYKNVYGREFTLVETFMRHDTSESTYSKTDSKLTW